MGKWLEKFKHKNMQLLSLHADSVDTLDTISTLAASTININLTKPETAEANILEDDADSIDTLCSMSTLSACNSRYLEKNNTFHKKLKIFLGEDWEDYKDNPEALHLWAANLRDKQLMESGIPRQVSLL